MINDYVRSVVDYHTIFHRILEITAYNRSYDTNESYVRLSNRYTRIVLSSTNEVVTERLNTGYWCCTGFEKYNSSDLLETSVMYIVLYYYLLRNVTLMLTYDNSTP